jgi:hypothetical protein
MPFLLLATFALSAFDLFSFYSFREWAGCFFTCPIAASKTLSFGLAPMLPVLPQFRKQCGGFDMSRIYRKRLLAVH